MLNILHIIPNLRKGGAERLVLDICNALQKNKDVKIKLVTFSYLNEYEFLTEKIEWEVIPASVNLSVWGKNQLNVEELQAAIENFQPTIIHTHLFEAEIVTRSCFYPKAKWFSHCHDNMVQFKNFGLHTALKKSSITNYFEKHYLFNRYKQNGGTQFIAISNHTLRYYKKTASSYPIHLLFNAIDFERFYFPLKQNKRSNKLRLINIGSFLENKNQLFLIEVSKFLKNKSINFELHFLGDGLLKEKLKRMTVKSGLDHAVCFHGRVDEVEKYLGKSDMYLHAAFSEALGLTIIEAMAAGLPVITLDGKGNRDLIEQGKNGYMLFESNVELFAQTIIDLWNNKETYNKIASYAQMYAKQFDIKLYVEKLLSSYRTN